MEEEATEFQYATIKPELGLDLVNITSTFQGASELDVGKGSVSVQQWDTTIAGMAMKVSEWVNDKGTVLQMHIESGTGLIEAVLSTELKAEAEAKAETNAPELVDSTNVHLDAPVGELHAWRGYRRATFTVHAKTGELQEELPSSGFQRVSKRSDGGLTVQVDMTEGSVADEADQNNIEYREASAMVDGTDPAVVEIAVLAVGRLYAAPDGPRTAGSIMERANKLRAAVKDHIKVFDLATGYASASETARRAAGDCSEHAVLLAAVLRSDGIPSRVCSGLVYTERQVSAEELNKGHSRDCDQGGCDEVETKQRYSGPGVRCAFSRQKLTLEDAILVPTPARLKLLLSCNQGLFSRVSAASYRLVL
jgi:hypothetical protein